MQSINKLYDKIKNENLNYTEISSEIYEIGTNMLMEPSCESFIQNILNFFCFLNYRTLDPTIIIENV